MCIKIFYSETQRASRHRHDVSEGTLRRRVAQLVSDNIRVDKSSVSSVDEVFILFIQRQKETTQVSEHINS